MHSAKDKHFRSFPIGTAVLSLADLKVKSSSSQHMEIFKDFKANAVTYGMLWYVLFPFSFFFLLNPLPIQHYVIEFVSDLRQIGGFLFG
jgi:hypothetical protein